MDRIGPLQAVFSVAIVLYAVTVSVEGEKGGKGLWMPAPIYDVTCDAEKLSANILGGQYQAVSVKGKGDDSNCSLVKDADDFWRGTFSFDPSNATHCGMSQKAENEGQRFEIKIQTQLVENVISIFDFLLVLTCLMKNDTSVWSNAVLVNVIHMFHYDDEDEFDDFVKLEITSSSDLVLGDRDLVYLGELLTFSFILPVNAVYKSFRIETCTADNNNKVSPVSMTFITNGCPSDMSSLMDIRDLREYKPVDGRPNHKTFELQAVVFSKGSNGLTSGLHFECHLMMCEDPTGCDQPTSCPGFRNWEEVESRRRRQASSGATKTVVVGQSLIVRMAEESASCRQNRSECEDLQKCLALTPIFVILTLFIVVTLILLICLGFALFKCLQRRRRQRQDEQREAEQAVRRRQPQAEQREAEQAVRRPPNPVYYIYGYYQC